MSYQSFATFRDSICLSNNIPLTFFNSTGSTRHNVILLNSNDDTLVNSTPGKTLYLNNTYTDSPTFINSSGGSNVIVRSKVGINLASDDLVTAHVTLPKGGYIGNNSTLGSSDDFVGIAGGYSLDNSVGSRIILNGNDTASADAGCLNIYSGNNTYGSVSVFTGTDKMRMSVSSSGSTVFSPDGTTSVLSIDSAGPTSIKPILISDSTESTGVGTGGSFTVLGGASFEKDVFVGGTMTSTSDMRLKKNIEDIEGTYLEKIESLRTVKFNYKTDTTQGLQYGFIAQDFEQEFPELLRKPNEDGMYTLDYQKVSVILVKCIKELKQEIELLKTL